LTESNQLIKNNSEKIKISINDSMDKETIQALRNSEKHLIISPRM